MKNYQIDCKSLKKGSVILQSELEKILDLPWNDPSYPLGVLQVKAFIEKTLNFECTLCTKQGDLHILTDVEASEYNYTKVGYGIRKISRGYKQLLLTDRSNLSFDESEVHHRRVENASRIVQALIRPIREISLKCAEVKEERVLMSFETRELKF